MQFTKLIIRKQALFELFQLLKIIIDAECEYSEFEQNLQLTITRKLYIIMMLYKKACTNGTCAAHIIYLSDDKRTITVYKTSRRWFAS